MNKNAESNWKRNFLKVPDFIASKVLGLHCDDVVVACVKRIPLKNFEDGIYHHLEITGGTSSPVFPPEILPKPTTGRYSKTNVHGKEIVRKDLPMVSKTISMETPNFGDWSLGSHTVDFHREVYWREFLPPKELAIRIERLGEDATTGASIVKFAVDQVLDRTKPGFDADLLYVLNLLQENVGKVDVFASTAPIADYLGTIYVDWELLPPGERSRDIDRILSGFGRTTPEVKQKLAERYDLLVSLYPQAFVSGASGFRRHFGAKFADDLVVFENLEHGNAIYVMFEDWEEWH